ncbi:MAG: zinc finger domain-containing protein [Candidatus Thermoplasmatota archaeon]|nr:zinc finger domain-containing protein [Candidatus Thermoplasmatota archaeon]
MAWIETKCTTCGRPLTEQGSVIFRCPRCGDTTIGRCVRCRDQSVPYACKKCDFHGP